MNSTSKKSSKYKYTDKVWYIDDILDEFEKQGGNRELASAIYNYFREELIKDAETTDNLVYRIPKIGNLHYTISGMLKHKASMEETLKKFPDSASTKKRIQTMESKIKKFEETYKECKSNDFKKKILFFKVRFNQKNIKNA